MLNNFMQNLKSKGTSVHSISQNNITNSNTYQYTRRAFIKTFDLIIKHIVFYPTSGSLSYLWGFGSLAGLMLAVQIVTGVILGMHYQPSADMAFESVLDQSLFQKLNFQFIALEEYTFLKFPWILLKNIKNSKLGEFIGKVFWSIFGSTVVLNSAKKILDHGNSKAADLLNQAEQVASSTAFKILGVCVGVSLLILVVKYVLNLMNVAPDPVPLYPDTLLRRAFQRRQDQNGHNVYSVCEDFVDLTTVSDFINGSSKNLWVITLFFIVKNLWCNIKCYSPKIMLISVVPFMNTSNVTNNLMSNNNNTFNMASLYKLSYAEKFLDPLFVIKSSPELEQFLHLKHSFVCQFSVLAAFGLLLICFIVSLYLIFFIGYYLVKKEKLEFNYLFVWVLSTSFGFLLLFLVLLIIFFIFVCLLVFNKFPFLEYNHIMGFFCVYKGFIISNWFFIIERSATNMEIMYAVNIAMDSVTYYDNWLFYLDQNEYKTTLFELLKTNQIEEANIYQAEKLNYAKKSLYCKLFKL